MIKNAILGLLLLSACDEIGGEPAVDRTGFQGVVEFEERTLAFEVNGRVREVAIEEGDMVEVGTELARIDDTLERLDREARAAEARAVRAELDLLEAGTRPEDIKALRAQRSELRTQLSLAQRNLGRQRHLSELGAGTAAALDEAQTAVAAGKAQLLNINQQLKRLRAGARVQEIEAADARAEAAETAVRAADERIARHVLVADEPGVVLEKHLEPGEFAAMGSPAVTIADVHHPYIDVFVPQGQIGAASLGASARVEVDAYDDGFAGSIEHISRETEFTPRFLFSPRERPNLVLRVRVRVDDPDARLHSGLPAFVTFGETAP
jgi:HlyD family secretion protein